MKKRINARAGRILALCLLAGPSFTRHASAEAPAMASHASGTFEVKVTPLPADEKVAGLTVGRVAVDKRLLGELEGTSKGEMMTAGPNAEGSGGYVAIEQVEGTLRGRKGTFLLLHQGTMKQNSDFKLTIVVVPDSGTGELAGLTGTMAIIIAGGKHSYEFDYTLPEAR
jgi:hypothetical protein